MSIDAMTKTTVINPATANIGPRRKPTDRPIYETTAHLIRALRQDICYLHHREDRLYEAATITDEMERAFEEREADLMVDANRLVAERNLDDFRLEIGELGDEVQVLKVEIGELERLMDEFDVDDIIDRLRYRLELAIETVDSLEAASKQIEDALA